ncbi:MAG: acetyl-CoA acetyltransferase, partial [Mycobacterium sp.]|nr:acetyl-CoA acetyltransferase [Mycobacterium sp.]
MSAVELASAAAWAALEDCGVADIAAVSNAIDTVAGIRQFEISGPHANPVLGSSNNYPRSVATRLKAAPARAILEPIGGQGPQHLITELAGMIAAGDSEVALVFGSDATSTERHFAKAERKPDFTETVGGSLEDRGYGLEGLFDDYTVAHGLVGAPVQYALLENARRGRLGLTPEAYLEQMAELFAPFTKVAANNPFAASPVERSVEEIGTVTESNRMICDPYLRLLVARDQVNQGAAALLMSVDTARWLGVPGEKWVYLRGHADVREQNLLDRVDLSNGPASVLAVGEALAVAGIGLDDIATFDLYSCFLWPVFNICDGTGLATDDSRGLTLTGGLPYFGGAGNNWQPHRNALLQDEIASWPTVKTVHTADGPATIETYTVRYDWPTTTGIIIGRLDADNSRFLATT